MGSQKGNNKGTGSIRDSGMVRESTNKVGPAGSGKKNKQGFNKKGTAYGGALADAMSKANAVAKASSLDKAMTRRPGAFSPQDVAAAAGRLAATREMENQFGSRNLARASFADLIGQQQDRLNNAIGGPRFRDELGQVRTAPNTFAQRVFNESTGVNPTTGMGIMDSLKSNYAMSQGIPGSGLFGAGLSLAAGIPGLGILANPIVERFFPSQDEEDLNKFGLPDYSPRRTINEYTTESTFSPTIEEAFDPDLRSLEDISTDAMGMRAVLPGPNARLGTRVTGPQLRLSGPQLRLPAPNARLGTNFSLTGMNLRPTGTTLNTAGSPFQNQNMLNQQLSKYGTVGNTSAQAQPKFSMPANRFNPISFLGKRSIPGLLMSGLSAVSSLDQGQPEDGSTFSEALDNLNRPMFNYDGEAVNPVFDFDPLGFLDREERFNQGGSVSPQRGPMSNGIGTLYKLK